MPVEQASTYDANGNQLTIEEPGGDVTTNVWDGENRLVAVEHPDFTVTSYAYNADGLKVEKDDGVAVTRFLYDGNNLLRELDDLGTVEAEFTYVPQPYAHLVSQQRDGDSSFYHFDGTRNTAALSDAAGVVTDEYEHDAWGKLRSSTGSTPNAHTWKGELLAYYGDPHAGPEKSIYSLHHRDYVTQQRRFRSEDPAEDDHNRYRPFHNDPINRVDPSGLQDRARLEEQAEESIPADFDPRRVPKETIDELATDRLANRFSGNGIKVAVVDTPLGKLVSLRNTAIAYKYISDFGPVTRGGVACLRRRRRHVERRSTCLWPFGQRHATQPSKQRLLTSSTRSRIRSMNPTGTSTVPMRAVVCQKFPVTFV